MRFNYLSLNLSEDKTTQNPLIRVRDLVSVPHVLLRGQKLRSRSTRSHRWVWSSDGRTEFGRDTASRNPAPNVTSSQRKRTRDEVNCERLRFVRQSTIYCVVRLNQHEWLGETTKQVSLRTCFQSNVTLCNAIRKRKETTTTRKTF